MTAGQLDTLTISGVSAGYGGAKVINGLSLPPLPHGELVALVGPNAAGKSTLLRAIACLLPSSGALLHGGTDLRRLSMSQRAERIGFMPQGFPVGTTLTVAESLVAAIRSSVFGDGRERPAVEEAFAIIDRLGISHLAIRPFDQLSGGQRQIASLALAICRKPPILLLDEPTNALDLARQFQIMSLVRDIVREGCIGIVVLHDLALAAQWADRIAVLHDSKLHGFDIPERAITPTMLREVYGIAARVERCSRGRLQIMTDGLAGLATDSHLLIEKEFA